jgi:lysophospholipase
MKLIDFKPPKVPRIGARRVQLRDSATGYDLPKSNQTRRLAIHDTVTGAVIDRRAIPPHAQEGTWQAADGHAIRRIDWPGAGHAARGSILFLPGRGDFYEKYLETLESGTAPDGG